MNTISSMSESISNAISNIVQKFRVGNPQDKSPPKWSSAGKTYAMPKMSHQELPRNNRIVSIDRGSFSERNKVGL